MRTAPLISLYQLSYKYPESQKLALEDVNLDLQEGQFVLIAGASGSGKSTLLRIMGGLIPRFYGGDLQGQIRLLGQDLNKWSHRDLSRNVGLLFQDPESQLATTRVDQELVFGLENMGYDRQLMEARRQEVAEVFTMEPWLYHPILHLSGGWKQKTVLASILASRPRLLLLDEPLSQLDEFSADHFLDYLEKCRRLWGMTIIVAEHRLEKLSQRADNVVYLRQGKVQSKLPEEVDLINSVQGAGRQEEEGRPIRSGKPLARIDKVDFQYPHTSRPVLKKLSLNLQAGEIACLRGANGAGKTTLLRLLIGAVRPLEGRVDIEGENPSRMPASRLARKIGYLSQEPGDYLFSPTVRQEIEYTCRSLKIRDGSRTDVLLEQLHLQHLAQRNPRDLSWGERQRTALASILAAGPSILLLDEPTRGLDQRLKAELKIILRGLANQGVSILVATHDQAMANGFADRILHLQNGVLTDSPSFIGTEEGMLAAWSDKTGY